MPQLVIIIVNYNTANLLPACLKGIFASEPPCHFEVQLVNNGPPEEIEDALLSSFPGIQIHQNSRNLGFGKAANLGASFWDAPYFLFLNPDVIPQPESWVRLWRSIETHPSAGMVVPKLVNPDGSLQYSCRRFYQWSTLILRRFPWNRIWPDHPAIQRNMMREWMHMEVHEVDWALGAAMLVRRGAISDQDIFDPRFFLYFEDVDLCFRLRQNGWRVLYDPSSLMVHQHKRESAGGVFRPVKFHHFFSLIKFLLKHRFRLRPFDSA
jgi:N-acetylglucosaminyl-diphospho-decaprenol L-rhamnosyltransferase